MTYCGVCGKPCDEVPDTDLPLFDRETGERYTHSVCPTGLCCHTGIPHDYERRIFRPDKCRTCGEIEVIYEGW